MKGYRGRWVENIKSSSELQIKHLDSLIELLLFFQVLPQFYLSFLSK